MDDADDKTPVELSFQDRYGEILAHQWFGDGYIVLGFASGYVRFTRPRRLPCHVSRAVHATRFTQANAGVKSAQRKRVDTAIGGTRV